MELITKKNIVELEYKIREGVLISRVNTDKIDEDGKYLIDILYKPTCNYGIEFHLGGMAVPDVKEEIMTGVANMIYDANMGTILMTISDIYNNSYEFDGSDIEALMQDEGIRNYIEKYIAFEQR